MRAARIIGVAATVVAISIGANAAVAEDHPVSVAIACLSDGKPAALTIAGERIAEPTLSSASSAIKRLIPDKHARIVFSDPEAPYQCLGGMVFRLQALGYDRVEFIGEPKDR
jgi:hypothetical protein